jgi:uncharacterized membrane protein YsdA (DUF1294 family)
MQSYLINSLLAYLIIINLFSFLLYGLDKYYAIKKHYRISEKKLLMMSLIGGSFGSLIAMYTFNHKKRVSKFVIINSLLCIIYTYLLIKIWS